ncbi:hypothetical protein SELMODRAFT_428873 [Selaginella moellendorffii]|uniref:Uncharacterized protein n=1 Tax=Selaginella moellendorffii TaxID=88036 RepID=D8T4A1_SELML|nr:hypothetical protein SELMODRAFT_428873 [Selaginella moellendorffii]
MDLAPSRLGLGGELLLLGKSGNLTFEVSSSCISSLWRSGYEIRGESVKHIRFDDDDGWWTLIPLQLSSLHPVLRVALAPLEADTFSLSAARTKTSSSISAQCVLGKQILENKAPLRVVLGDASVEFLLRFACGVGTAFMTSSGAAHDGGVHGMEMAKVPRGPPQLVTKMSLAIWDTTSFRVRYRCVFVDAGLREPPWQIALLTVDTSTTYITGCPARSIPRCTFNCTASASQMDVDVEDKKAWAMLLKLYICLAFGFVLSELLLYRLEYDLTSNAKLMQFDN